MSDRFLPGIADFSYCINKWRLKSMKDPAFIEEAAILGAKVYQFDFLFPHEGGAENRAAVPPLAREKKILLTAADYGTPSIERFRQQVAAAQDAGVELVRHACGPFLGLQEPMPREELVPLLREAATIYEEAGLRLAIENHQDYTSDQFAEMLSEVGSPHVGVMLDTGNSIALLEDPVETARTLAPFTFGLHLKEYAVLEAPGGFDLVGVELGSGIVDNARVLEIVAANAPGGTLPLLLENPIERCRIRIFTAAYARHMGDVPLAAIEPVAEAISRSREYFPEGIVLPFENPALSREEIGAAELEHNRRAFAKLSAYIP